MARVRLTFTMFDWTIIEIILLILIDYQIARLVRQARDNTERRLLLTIDCVIWMLAILHK